MARSSYKSLYEAANPHKYIGNPKNICCRSSWERFFCSYLDHSKKVTGWSSEELAIPYTSPKDGNVHRYFVDFVVKFDSGEILLVEIKPFSQKIPPVKPKRSTPKALQRYQEEMMVYAVNQAKWSAARDFAKRNGFSFEIFTENELRSLGGPF